MNLLERVLTLLRANLNSVVEKADDPEKALQQLQLDMRNQLVQVKTEVAKAIAEGHTLQKRATTRKAEADGWLRKAEQAVQQGNDNAARAALTHYNDINRLVQRYQQQKKEQERLVLTLRNALHQLEAKLSEVDTTIDLLVTRKRNALIQQRVLEALNRTENGKDKKQAGAAQDAIINGEARIQASTELQSRLLDTQPEQVYAEQQVEQQLQKIKDDHAVDLEPAPNESLRKTGPLLSPHSEQDGRAGKRSNKHASRPLPQTQAELSTDKELDLEYLKRLLDAPQGSDY